MIDIYRRAANGEGQIASFYSLCKKPKAIIQFVHDISEHCGRYFDIAELFNAEGFDFYANDIVGHGMSKQGHPGAFSVNEVSLENMLEDIGTLFDYSKEKSGEIPHILVGVGFGAALSAMYTAKYKDTDLLLLLSPIQKMRGKKIAKIMSSGEVWLTSDELYNKKYANDVNCGFNLNKDSYKEVKRACDHLVNKKSVSLIPDIPVCLIAGKKDPLGNYGNTAIDISSAFSYTNHSHVSLKLYDGYHDLLHDDTKDEVMQDITKWIAGTIE